MMKAAVVAGQLLLLLAISCSTHDEELTGTPRLSDLQQSVVRLVADRWARSSSEAWTPEGEAGLQGVEIWEVRRADCLLAGIPVRLDLVKPLHRAPVYLVHAIAKARWWKLTTDHVLVVQFADGSYRSLLHFDGGWNWKGVRFQIVDAGETKPDFVLLVQDDGCGNQMSQTQTHIFRWNRAFARFDEVFNELTTSLPGAGPGVAPRTDSSDLDFKSSGEELKDIVVTTELGQAGPGDKHWTWTTRTSCFRWDKTRYVGELDLLVTPDRVAQGPSQAEQIDAGHRIDRCTVEEARRVEAFKSMRQYSAARAAVISFAEAYHGRVVWCDCVGYSPETHYEILRPEAFVFRVFVANDGTFVESIPEMTTLIGWLPGGAKVHGYYSDIFPHPWDSRTTDHSEVLSEAAKSRIRKREAGEGILARASGDPGALAIQASGARSSGTQ